MEEKISLNGVIDMHVHTAPDVCGRTYNDLELTAAAVRAGARAIVIKGHHCSTVARAATPITEWHLTAIHSSCTAGWF
mgnify:CR=1 FL=1